MKKIVSILLLCAMLASTLASCAWSKGTPDPEFYPVDGIAENTDYNLATSWNGSASDTSWYDSNTSASTFYIEDGADLKGFITLVHSKNVTFAGKTVQLKKDINLGKQVWAIPASNAYFQGTFDGNGKTIGGFKMTCADGNQGVLGSIGGSAVVKNLTVISDGTITLKATAATTGAAGLVGRVFTVQGKTAKIENVTVTTTISYNTNGKSYTYVGGLVGAVEGNGALEITGCTNNSKITSAKATVGGIVGGVKNTTASLTITNCKNTGAITGLEAVGGIVGGIEGPKDCTVKITGCENTGAITIESGSTKGCAAGIVGRCRITNGSLTVTGCKNSGAISYKGNTTGGCWLGGILGYVYGDGSTQLGTVLVKDCHSTGKITANRTSGGLVGFFQRIDKLTVEDCTVNAEMIFNIRTEYNYYVGGLIGIIHTNNMNNTAVIKNCSVSGKMTVNEPEALPSYTGGIFGALRKSNVDVSNCHVDVEFLKENCEADDIANIVLGINEEGSNAATINATNMTYNFYNINANPENYVKIKSDSTIFKPIGFQSRYNEASNTYDLRFVFGMDNLQSADKIVGFEVALKNLDIEVTTNTVVTTETPVYTNLKADGKTFTPADYYSEYFATYTITGIPASEIELFEKDGEKIAVLKNKLISLTPFSMINADSELKKGIGVTDFSAVKPDTHTFEIQDFWSFLPPAFNGVTGVISSKNVGFKTPSNVECSEYKQLGKVNDQYVLKNNCKCTGDECTHGWSSTGAVAYKKNPNVPYHYYIDLATYKSSAYFGEELDRYEAYHTWTFDVAEDGYYEFCFRIRLNGADNSQQTRYALVQFDDEGYASQTEFYYSLKARDGSLRDNAENHDSYITGYGRYMTKGKHTITFRLPYDENGVDKNISFHFRDIYMIKSSPVVDKADIPVPAGATLYDGNFDATTCTYVLDKTTKTVFDNYRNELVKAGFAQKDEKVTDYQFSKFDVTNTPSGGNYTYTGNYTGNKTYHNYFYTYTNAEYMIHVYFCEGDGGMRVIVSNVEEYDKYVAVNEKNKTYTDVTDPMFALLDIGGKEITLTKGANAGTKITGVANGMCLVYRLSDGRFVIVDGGYWNAKDTEGECVERLYNWLAEHADYDKDGNYKNNKITIAAWIFTHHHSDHISVGWKFNQMYQGKNNVTVENYLYNFPDYEYAIGTPGSNIDPGYYTEWFPKMGDLMKRNNNLVAHTGFEYQFADMHIEILYTHEDYFPNSIKSFNNSNTIYKITLAGKTFLVAGDLEEPGQIDAIKMTGTLLEADFLQVTHHGCNGQIEFFKYIVGLDASGNFNTDTTVIWPLPKGEDMSWFDGTSARAVAMRWLKEMFRQENNQANDNIHYAIENWVFTDFAK